jgi:hypothetical protein
VIRALMIVAVTGLLVLPALPRPAKATRHDSREATADSICLEHYGVRSTTRTLVTCADGALHRWDGSHVMHNVTAGSR